MKISTIILILINMFSVACISDDKTIVKGDISAEELTALAVSHGNDYISLREEFLKKYDFSKISIENYKHPALHLAITILKSRQNGEEWFDKLEKRTDKWPKYFESSKTEYDPRNITDVGWSLFEYCSWPNGKPVCKSTSESLLNMRKEGKPKQEISKVLNSIIEENERIKTEKENNEYTIRKYAKVAVLEYIWKLSRSYDNNKVNPERIGILEFFNLIGGEDVREKSLKTYFDEFSGKENVSWVAMDWLYNIDSLELIYFRNPRFYYKMMLGLLEKYECYGCVEYLDKVKENLQGKGIDKENSISDLLDKAIEEFKTKTAPEIKWKGLIQCWPTPDESVP